MEELEAIRNHPVNDHVILIDDMRLFRSQKDWAKGLLIDKMVTELHKINPRYKISFLKGYTDNDVLCATIQ